MALTFNYESNTDGFNTHTVTQTVSSEVLQAVSESQNLMSNNYLSGSGGNLGTDTDALATDYGTASESSVTFSLQDGRQFDLTSIDFMDWVGAGETIKITTSKGSTDVTVPASGDNVIANITGLGNASDFRAITSFTVTAQDGWMEAISFDNIILDNISPTITNVSSSTANGSYKAGDVISISVSFNEAVTVSGTPQLTLETGTTDRTINYASGSTSSTLIFNYTVQAGDTSADLDYISATALALNGGTITSTSNGMNASLTLATPGTATSLGDNKAIVIDTTAPAAPTLDLSSGSDTGSSNTDNITNDTTPTITGTGEANATVTLYDTDGTTSLGTTTANGSGNWSFTSSALSAGAHTLTAKQTDTAGNTSVASSGLSVSIDTTATAPTGLDLDVGSDTGSSNSDNITNDTTPTISGGGAESGATVTLYDTDGTTSLGTATADGSGNWSITSSALSAGTHTLTAKQTDTAGNISSALSSLSVIIDTTAPAAPTLDLSSGSDTGSSNTDNITNDTTPTITGTGEANATVTLYDTDGITSLGTATADGSGNWSFTTSALSAGAHTLTAKQTDTAGNTSVASSGLSVSIDTTATAPTGLDLDVGSDTGSSNSDNITNDTTPTISGGGAESGATVTLYDTDGTTSLGTATADGSGNWSITSSALSAGTHTLTAKQTDTAGNISSALSSLGVNINSDSPTDITLSNNTASTSAGENAVVGALSSTDTTVGDSFIYTLVAGNGTNDHDNASFNINGSDLRVNNSTSLGAGTYSVLVRTTDIAGNFYEEAQSITITTNPTVTITADDSSLKAGQTATITFTFSEAPTGFDASDITVSDGTLSAISSSSATVYTATYTPDTNVQSINETIVIAADTFTGSGNNNLVSNTLSITGDTFAPTVVSIDRQTPATVTTNADTLVYRVTFAEIITAIDTTDFSVTGSSATVTNVASAGGNAYDITVSGGNLASVSGTVSLAFSGGQNITDIAGNALSVTTPSGTNNPSYTLDNIAPIVSSVAVPSSTTYGLGENLDFIVNFDDTVSVDTSGGTPRIALDIGGSTVYATYISGSGSSALRFRYTTQTGDSDADGITIGALSANGGTLRDTLGNDATLTLNSVADTSAVMVNTAPTVSLTTDHASIAEAAGTATITATLSAVASTDTTVTLTTAGTATGSGTDYTISSTTITITAGNTTGTATVTAVQDSTHEGNETVVLDILGVSGGDDAYESGTQQVTLTIVDDDAAPVVPSTPSTSTTTIDGATVETGTTTNANGNLTEEVIISSVSANRVDQTGAEATADVPLFWGESSRTDWATTASLPTGIGLSATGARSPQTGHTIANALSDLTAIINDVAPTDDPSRTNMLSGASDFLQSLNNVTDNLVVNQITFTSTNTTASATPITITGTADAVSTASGDMVPTEALVIDARALPAGSILQLQNVEFAIILGDNLIVRGGEGQNIIFAGEGNQDIMCGPEDDELHAGAGDDTVGSAGGNDLIFGESGNDTVFGGEGDDLLHGGSGVDIATYSGNINDYTITRDEGKTYVTLVNNPDGVDTLINVESIQFADGTYTVQNDLELTQVATLYYQVLGRQAEINGFQYWVKDTSLSLGQIGINFIESSEYIAHSGINWDSLDLAGKVETFYEAFLGRASDADGKTFWLDTINAGMTVEDVAKCFIDSVEMQGIYLNTEDWNFLI